MTEWFWGWIVHASYYPPQVPYSVEGLRPLPVSGNVKDPWVRAETGADFRGGRARAFVSVGP
jgi:hypothetical protein